MEVLEMLFYHPEKKCKDHTGREFPSIKAMCEFWNIPPETFRRRMAVYGYPLEKALSMPLKSNSNNLCYDHLGAEFRSKFMEKNAKINNLTFVLMSNII